MTLYATTVAKKRCLNAGVSIGSMTVALYQILNALPRICGITGASAVSTSPWRSRGGLTDFIRLIFTFSNQEVPNPNLQTPNNLNRQIPKNPVVYWLFAIIEEKISVNSRASAASWSRADKMVFVKPISRSRKNKRLSFASFRQIFTRIRKSFLLKASSASIQLAATEPEARTNCRTSSALLMLLGGCFTNNRTDSAKRKVRSSRSRGFGLPSIYGFGFGPLFGIWNLEFVLPGSVHGRK